MQQHVLFSHFNANYFSPFWGGDLLTNGEKLQAKTLISFQH